MRFGQTHVPRLLARDLEIKITLNLPNTIIHAQPRSIGNISSLVFIISLCELLCDEYLSYMLLQISWVCNWAELSYVTSNESQELIIDRLCWYEYVEQTNQLDQP